MYSDGNNEYMSKFQVFLSCFRRHNVNLQLSSAVLVHLKTNDNQNC